MTAKRVGDGQGPVGLKRHLEEEQPVERQEQPSAQNQRFEAELPPQRVVRATEVPRKHDPLAHVIASGGRRPSAESPLVMSSSDPIGSALRQQALDWIAAYDAHPERARQADRWMADNRPVIRDTLLQIVKKNDGVA